MLGVILIQMRTDQILTFYWDIFTSHVCEFHRLDREFISEYEYELDWNAISKNKVIECDLGFLEQYEDRFVWHELALNEAILWDEAKIERFKKRLDWYYLGRNRNLPITEELIIKYSKKLSVVEDNPWLTKELTDKYKIKVLPKNANDSQKIKDYQDSDFDRIFNQFNVHNGQKVIYEKLFLPIIERKGSLDDIFREKFDYRQRYYFFEPIKEDIKGLTPEFQIQDLNPFEDSSRKGREPIELRTRLTLTNGPRQEGPDRLYEVPRFTSLTFTPCLLVSENVKLILERYKLPYHSWHEVNMVHKKIKTNTKFYLLQLAFDTLNKDLAYQNASFHYFVKEFSKRGHGPVEEKIENHSSLMNTQMKLARIHTPVSFALSVRADRYELTTDYDLYTYSVHGKVIVNQFLKDALEKNFPGQISFRSAQLLNIKIDQSRYDEKGKLAPNIKLSSKLAFKESEEDKFYFAKIERLEKSDPPFDISLKQEDKFSKKEAELKVLFPEVFKNNYLNDRIKFKGYRILPISKFYLQSEYADRYPETYKSVVIAENGLGDSINLMLEKDSDYKLHNRLFEFFHETGEYEEVW